MLSYQRLDMSLRILMLAGAVPLALVVAAVEQNTGGLVAALLLFCLPLGIALFSGTILRTRKGRLVAGFVPFYWVRLPLDRIERIEVAEVKPFEDFGGWGIKGRSRGRGLLFSAGGTEAVSVRMDDGRHYLVSSPEADRVVAQLRGQLAEP